MRLGEKKKEAVLAGLLIVMALYWGWGMLHKPGAEVNQTPGSAARAPRAAPKTVISVNIDLLKRPRPGYTAEKNIFSPVYKKPELVKPGSGSGSGSRNITVVPGALPGMAGGPAGPPLPPPPPPKPQAEIDADNAREEMQKMKVLGFLKRKDREDVFLSLGGENFIVAKGEKITKEYYLNSIEDQAVVVVDKKTGVDVKLSTEPGKGGAANAPASAGGQGLPYGAGLPNRNLLLPPGMPGGNSPPVR
ncbi:MAG: hypothetical protein ABSG42_04540 [Nitrospirota bacterium]